MDLLILFSSALSFMTSSVSFLADSFKILDSEEAAATSS